MLDYFRKSPYYMETGHAHIIYLYRMTMYRLTRLFARLRNSNDAMTVMDEFYIQVAGCEDAFALAFRKLCSSSTPSEVFQNYGTKLALTYYDDKQYTQVGGLNDLSNTLIVIRTET
jgi:hypothetical protein